MKTRSATSTLDQQKRPSVIFITLKRRRPSQKPSASTQKHDRQSFLLLRPSSWYDKDTFFRTAAIGHQAPSRIYNHLTCLKVLLQFHSAYASRPHMFTQPHFLTPCQVSIRSIRTLRLGCTIPNQTGGVGRMTQFMRRYPLPRRCFTQQRLKKPGVASALLVRPPSGPPC